MSKKAKQLRKLLKQKTLTSDEAVRLLELDGWIPDKNSRQRGSHKYFVHPVKKGKITVPKHEGVLAKDTKDDIFIQAGFTGD